MTYYKSVIDGFITAIVKYHDGHWTVETIMDGLELTEIQKPEYDILYGVMQRKPYAEIGSSYRLHADTLEWELVELLPESEPELSAEEVLDILLGGDGE